MCFSHLSTLEKILPESKIELLNKYFSGLIGGARTSITASKVAHAIACDTKVASTVLTICKTEGIVTSSYGIRCPKCNLLISKVDSLSDVFENANFCYQCEEEVEITAEDIEVIYSLTDEMVFLEGQQGREIIIPDLDRPVAREDTLLEVFDSGNINAYLFSPSEKQYQELQALYHNVLEIKGNTKEMGDTLELLIKKLFSVCSIFQASGIRTKTNQIDVFVRNKIFVEHGIFAKLGGRIFIECKNENKTPSGTYVSKLHSIILNSYGNTEIMRLGILVSKEGAPGTFRLLSNKIYLRDKIVMISIDGNELRQIIFNKDNLLDVIERKIDEVVLDATIDL